MNFSTYNEYKKAFSEVDFILNNSEENITGKVPEEFRRLIRENMDEEYVITFDLKNGLENCKLLSKTKDILSLIYRDYICTKEEKEKLKKEWSKLEEAYNTSDILAKLYEEKASEITSEESTNSLVEVPKQKWYKELINKILGILKK